MSANPNPARTTEPMWQFVERVIGLEPADFVWSGCYVFKSGYHSTVDDNLANWPNDYSIRLAADLNGPRDKGRGIDIKSKQAASGASPTIMATYGSRMRAAGKARDPRVQKWREVLGQFDTDKPPEAIDFQSTAERVPDSTHEWHFHWSILTQFVNDPEAYDAMYSVMIGQSLADYQANGVSDMTPDQAAQLAQIHAMVRADRWMWITDRAGFIAAGGDPKVWDYGGGMGENKVSTVVSAVESGVKKAGDELMKISQKLDGIAAGGGLTEADRALLQETMTAVNELNSRLVAAGSNDGA